MLKRDLRLVFTPNLVGSFGNGLFSRPLPVYMGSSARNMLFIPVLVMPILAVLVVRFLRE